MDAQIFNDIVSAFVQALQAGTQTLTSYAFPLLAITATLAFYFQVGPQLASGAVGLGDTLGGFLLLVLKIGIIYWIVLDLPELADAAFNTFLQWGAAVGGGFTGSRFLNPGVIVDTGFQVARPIRDFTDSLLAWATHDWGTMIAYSLAFYAIVIGFFLIALHLMMTIIEFNLAVMAGTVLIPWGVFPALAFLGESSVSWIIGGLVKVLVTAALVSMALPLFARVVFTPSSGGDPTFYSATLCGLVSLLFAILAWVIPGRAGAIASRGVSLALSGSDVVAGAMTGTRVAVLAAGAVRNAMRGTSTLVQATRQGYNSGGGARRNA